MRIECVIDSSSLVSLCKCGLQGYLKESGWKFISVKEVFDEVVREGGKKGLLDAFAAKKLFGEGVVSVLALPPFTGKGTDEKVVALAVKRKAVVLANDVKLLRRAAVEGLDALASAGFLYALVEAGSIDSKKFTDCLSLLVGMKRLSRENAEKYLEVG